MLPARMLLDLLKASGLCMVCFGNVSLKTDARKSRSQWSLNCICTDSVTPRCVHKPNLRFLGFMLVNAIFLDLMAVVKVHDAT